MAHPDPLSAADVRRAVTWAQFAPTVTTAADVLAATGILQLDPLSRVDKAHRLTALARLGARARSSTVDGTLWRDDHAVAFETFSRIACLVPVSDWQLHRLDRERRGSQPLEDAVRDRILGIVAARPDGATVGEIESETGSDRTTGWSWSPVKTATERLLRHGDLVVTARRGVARLFDLPERRLPAEVLAQRLDDDEVLVGLAHRALESLAVVTPADLTRVFSLTRPQATAALSASQAHPVTVEGWRDPAFLSPGAAAHLGATTDESPLDGPRLIGPFDQLLRDRGRAKRVFDFDYTFEAYKPIADRVHGHYVLGVFAVDRFVARVDAKREDGVLRLGPVFPEPGVRMRSATAAARRAGRRLARQLGVELELLEPVA